MTTQKSEGQLPSAEQLQLIQTTADQWRKVSNDAPIQALARAEDAAKQLIGINAGLQGLFFAIFAFSDLRKVLASMHLPFANGFFLLFFFVPILLWLVSLYCAVQVFVPKERLGVNLNDVSIDGWVKTKQVYEEAVDKKMRWLHHAHRWLVASFAAVIFLIVIYAFLPTI
jgi:hypothetical protein